MKIILSFLVFLILTPNLLFADLSVPHFFSDHMVLQRERAAAIWGTADANAEITIVFKDKVVTTRASGDGKWRTEIETGGADGAGATLVISSGADKIEIKDVLVGEVWFASGQSNMHFTVDRVPEYNGFVAESTYPGLRMFNAPLVTAVDDQDDIDGVWTSATPETTAGFSAVAFFFARKLHLDLHVPIGVIKSSWGGKPVETFTSREALSTLPSTQALVDATLKADAEYDQAKADAAYAKQLEKWQATVAEARKKPADQRGKLTKKPLPSKRPLVTEGKPGVLFASMIHPFIGYTMRGAIWYQGEANAKAGAVPYDETLPLMIRDWRQRWGDDFSFYYVQLANYHAPSTEPGTADPWALLQDRMRRILDTTPKTGMAIINEIGDAKDIHPKNKRDPGERLARWALAKDYGMDLIYSGPLFQSSDLQKDAIRITFEQSGAGLKSRDGGPLKRFEIAGADKVWHWADAKIDTADSVIVSSPQVMQPVAVRYAWAANPEGANLVNSDGLPASVFRTDDWDDVEPKADLSVIKTLEGRRALAAEIAELNLKRTKLDRKSTEFQENAKKTKELLDKFRAVEPAK